MIEKILVKVVLKENILNYYGRLQKSNIHGCGNIND